MSMECRQFDVLVLGGGAAGLICAAVAGQRGRSVAVLEHNGQVGRKILISGGGRCNFTNLYCEPANFTSANPHFAKSALALYEPRHFIEMVNRYGIAWHEKTLGQLFCDGSARAIVDMLLAECERSADSGGAVEIVLNAREITVERDAKGQFHLESSAGQFAAEALVVATGGLSIPRMGATGFAYDLAQQFGLELVTPRPGLVPLVVGEDEAAWTQLAGVSADVVATASGTRFREKMLVTHRGFSGPAVLQASSYWRPGEALLLDFAPALDGGEGLLKALRAPGARRDLNAVKAALTEVLPKRLAAFLAEKNAPEGWTNTALEKFENKLRRYALHPVGTEGFEKAEVTAGGVDTAGLQARTMEVRKKPGLFFVGEAVDVTGWLGGFNFQWAWASGVAAGRHC